MNLGIHRIVIKVQIDDNRLYKPFKAGEILVNDGTLSWLKAYYPNSFIEVQMNEQEWLQYFSNEVYKCYLKAIKLQHICDELGLDAKLPNYFEQATVSLHIEQNKGGIINTEVYGGGLNDVINKAWNYKTDVDNFEETVFSKINMNSKTM